jgi:hypothetical protein
MIVGQHVAVRGDDHTRTGPQRGREGAVRIVIAAMAADAHHRRPGVLSDVDNGTRVDVEQGIVGL